jgi:hypothetical protein
MRTTIRSWPSGRSAKAFDAHETAAPREFRAATVMPARSNLYDQRLYKVVD